MNGFLLDTSRDPDKAYVKGQDEILTRLAKVPIKVISRTSTQHFKSSPDNLPQIAKQLGVAHIVEGSVQKAGDAVRVNVQLIRRCERCAPLGGNFRSQAHRHLRGRKRDCENNCRDVASLRRLRHVEYGRSRGQTRR